MRTNRLSEAQKKTTVDKCVRVWFGVSFYHSLAFEISYISFTISSLSHIEIYKLVYLWNFFECCFASWKLKWIESFSLNAQWCKQLSVHLFLPSVTAVLFVRSFSSTCSPEMVAPRVAFNAPHRRMCNQVISNWNEHTISWKIRRIMQMKCVQRFCHMLNLKPPECKMSDTMHRITCSGKVCARLYAYRSHGNLSRKKHTQQTTLHG